MEPTVGPIKSQTTQNHGFMIAPSPSLSIYLNRFLTPKGEANPATTWMLIINARMRYSVLKTRISPKKI